MRRLIAIGLVVFAAAPFLTMPAVAGADCNRSKFGVQCEIDYRVSPAQVETLRFGIRNNFGAPGARNYVETEAGWLDSDNNRDHRRWNGRVGKPFVRYWRGFANYWRACVRASRPRFVCTPWAYRGPRPLGSPGELLFPDGAGRGGRPLRRALSLRPLS
jgi:hypothetical protein